MIITPDRIAASGLPAPTVGEKIGKLTVRRIDGNRLVLMAPWLFPTVFGLLGLVAVGYAAGYGYRGLLGMLGESDVRGHPFAAAGMLLGLGAVGLLATWPDLHVTIGADGLTRLGGLGLIRRGLSAGDIDRVLVAYRLNMVVLGFIRRDGEPVVLDAQSPVDLPMAASTLTIAAQCATWLNVPLEIDGEPTGEPCQEYKRHLAMLSA